MRIITKEQEAMLVKFQAIASLAQDQITAVGEAVAHMMEWSKDDPRISDFVNGVHLLDFYEAANIDVKD